KETRDRLSRSRASGELPSERESVENGEYPRHTPADQIDPEHVADHQGAPDGGGVEDAEGADGRGRRPAVFQFDESRPCFPATTDGLEVASASASARSEEGTRGYSQHRQRPGRPAEHEPVPRSGQ